MIRFTLALLLTLFLNVQSQASECLQRGYQASHESSQLIIDAFKEKDVHKIANMMADRTHNGPSLAYVSKSKFDDLFSDETRKSVISVEGAADQCVPMGYKGSMIGAGMIWLDYVPEDWTGDVKVISLNITEPITINTNRAKNSFLRSKSGLLHPACFSYEWFSSDNYKVVSEYYGIDDWRDLSKRPGMFFGQKITDFELVETGWDRTKVLHIGYKTSQCTISQDKAFLDAEYGVISKTCDSVCAFNAYKLLYEIPLEKCNELASNFQANCISSYLVRVSSGDEDPYTSRHIKNSWAIYGVFESKEHGEVIFPLINFSRKDEALEYLAVEN